MNINNSLTKKLIQKNNNTLTNICSIDNTNIVSTCLPDDIINKISHSINQTDINIDNITEKLECNYKDKNRDICILDNAVKNGILEDHESDDIKFKHFKPFAPSDPTSWLGNDDIDTIQEQLYKLYPEYFYSFIHMIDIKMIKHKHFIKIDHKIESIKEINFYNKIQEGYKTYGTVFNTDPSTKGGQHWFAIFFDFRNSGSLYDPYTLEYFNSSGEPITYKPFQEFLLNLASKLSDELKKCVKFIQVTDIQHQGLDPVLGENSGNCGVYSIYYIWSRLENIHYSVFNDPEKIITDNMITNFRSKIFRSIE